MTLFLDLDKLNLKTPSSNFSLNLLLFFLIVYYLLVPPNFQSWIGGKTPARSVYEKSTASEKKTVDTIYERV